jgi:hypothetical protein
MSLFVMVAFILTLGLNTSFAQDTTKAKAKHKAKVEKTTAKKAEKAPKAEKAAPKAEKAPKTHKKAAKKDSTKM